MSMSDPLGDMLARIRNAQQAGKSVVVTPSSKLRENVCAVLKSEGYIRGYSVQDADSNKRNLTIELKYSDGIGAIREMRRVSKPGRRIYSSVSEMPVYYNGLGTTVISTPKGVMADHEARTANVGGEVLCQIF